MVDAIILIPLLVGFITTLILLNAWKKKAKDVGLLWEDMNKYEKPKIPGSGGIAVVTGFILGILTYIAINTFYFKSSENIIDLFALTTSFLILAGIGLFDDLLGWRKGGLSKKFRMFLALFAAIPLIVINSGASEIGIPLIGNINLGVLYALIIIPLGIVATATTFNFLAGFNGLEAGQGILIFSALSITTYLTGSRWLAFICFLLVIALIPFWHSNKFPAKIFPGDVLTYPLGGMIAIIAILGNVEKIAMIFFIPYIIEVILKGRGRLRKQSFGKPDKKNNLTQPYNKVYGLEHYAIKVLGKIKKEVKEKDVVYFIYGVQLIFILIGFIVLKGVL